MWPIGALMLTIAVLRMSKPLIEFNKQTISSYKLMGKKKSHDLNEIHSIETSDQGAKLRFNDGAVIVVNYKELNQLDGEQFKRFVGVQNKLKL